MSSCECVFAEELVEQGRLDCEDMPLCPAGCSICKSCLTLLGCAVPVTSSIETSRSFFFLVAICVGLLIFGLVYYYNKEHSRSDSDLAEQLINDDDDEAFSPVSPPGGASCEDEPDQVWLAPDAPPAQFEPSAKAAGEADASEYSVSSAGGPIPVCPLPAAMSNEDDSSDGETGKEEDDDQEKGVWLAPIS